MPVHRRADLILGRVLRRGQKISSLDHHPVLAVTAMRHLNVDPRLLKRVQCRRSRRRATACRVHRRKAFQRGDCLARNCSHRCDAAPDLLAVQEHRARTTLRKTATEARAVQVELVVQDVEERSIKTRGHAMNETVHLDLQLARHSYPPVIDRKSPRAEPFVPANASPATASETYERPRAVAIVTCVLQASQAEIVKVPADLAPGAPEKAHLPARRLTRTECLPTKAAEVSAFGFDPARARSKPRVFERSVTRKR